MNSHGPAITPRDRLIVALDVSTAGEALSLVEELKTDVHWFKIGLQLFTSAGPRVIDEIAACGADIFLDLKLHDIPNTVAKAVSAAGKPNVKMLTLHLSGGRAMIEAAVAAKRHDLALAGVTVLTSSDAATLRETGIRATPEEQVLRLANLAAKCGIEAIVASPREIAGLRRELGAEMKIITPGVRPQWAAADDQKRVMTPREALDAGADYLVVGRPITAHASPREAIRQILAELSA